MAKITPQRIPKECPNAKGLQGEMWRVYREARLGKLDTVVMNKFIYALTQIVQATVASDLEKRIEALEGE